MRVVFSPDAELDLLRLWDYLQQYDEDAANRAEHCVFKTIDSLSRFPHIGKPTANDGFRELVVAGTRYVMVYEVLPECVLTTRIVHGAKDWPGRF